MAGLYPALRRLFCGRGVQALDEKGAGAADAAFHCAGGALAGFGGFLVGKAEAEDEVDRVGHVRRQAGDLGEEAGILGGVLGRVAVDQHVLHLVAGHRRHAALAAQALQPFIAQDTEDPRAEGAGRVEACGGGQRTHAGVLYAVIGQDRVAAELAGIGAQGGKAVGKEFGQQVFAGARPGGAKTGEGPGGVGRREALGVGHRSGCPIRINPTDDLQSLTKGLERVEMILPDTAAWPVVATGCGPGRVVARSMKFDTSGKP